MYLWYQISMMYTVAFKVKLGVQIATPQNNIWIKPNWVGPPTATSDGHEAGFQYVCLKPWNDLGLFPPFNILSLLYSAPILHSTNLRFHPTAMVSAKLLLSAIETALLARTPPTAAQRVELMHAIRLSLPSLKALLSYPVHSYFFLFHLSPFSCSATQHMLIQ